MKMAHELQANEQNGGIKFLHQFINRQTKRTLINFSLIIDVAAVVVVVVVVVVVFVVFVTFFWNYIFRNSKNRLHI